MSADENLKQAQKAINLTKNHITCSNNLRGDRLASFDGGIEELIDLWKHAPIGDKYKTDKRPIGAMLAPVHQDAQLVPLCPSLVRRQPSRKAG